MVDPTESIDFVWQLNLHILFMYRLFLFFLPQKRNPHVLTEVRKDFKLLLHITLAAYCHWLKEY
jgi:hypothetical protein